MASTTKIRFGIAGAGWRAEFFLRVAALCPDRFEVTGLMGHTPERATAVAARFGVRCCASVKELVGTKPAFVVTTVPRTANPALIRELAEAGMPVLSETPPAGTVEELSALFSFVQARGARVQVAEQYLFQPLHAARLAFVAGGALGKVSQVQVSIAHGYHAMSLMRLFLQAGFADAVISGRSFAVELTRGPNREGPPATESLEKATTQFVFLDFGDRLGLYDFAGVQYMSYIRRLRLIVQGTRGEIVNEEAVCLRDHVTPIRSTFIRHEAGPGGNLEGNFLKGIQAGGDWVYRNPLAPGRLSDDEIAVGTCLLRMADYVETGKPCYSLADACQDTYLDLMCQQALASGQPVKTERQVWAV